MNKEVNSTEIPQEATAEVIAEVETLQKDIVPGVEVPAGAQVPGVNMTQGDKEEVQPKTTGEPGETTTDQPDQSDVDPMIPVGSN